MLFVLLLAVTDDAHTSVNQFLIVAVVLLSVFLLVDPAVLGSVSWYVPTLSLATLSNIVFSDAMLNYCRTSL